MGKKSDTTKANFHERHTGPKNPTTRLLNISQNETSEIWHHYYFEVYFNFYVMKGRKNHSYFMLYSTFRMQPFWILIKRFHLHYKTSIDIWYYHKQLLLKNVFAFFNTIIYLFSFITRRLILFNDDNIANHQEISHFLIIFTCKVDIYWQCFLMYNNTACKTPNWKEENEIAHKC